MIARSSPPETGRPGSLTLPASHEFWFLLERFNKAALARRFPGWDTEAANDPTQR